MPQPPTDQELEGEEAESVRIVDAQRIVAKVNSDFTNEMIRATRVNLATAGDTLPENNYWAFSTGTILLQEIFGVLKPTPAASAASGLGWNIVDGVCQGFVGVNQVLDNETHRPKVSKVKGTMNILSSTQIIVLSSVSMATFGAGAFAAAFGTAFVLSLEDSISAIRRYYSLSYFIKDGLNQIKKYNEMIQQLTMEMKQLEDNELTGFGMKWALRQKKNRLADITSEKVELEKHVLYRVALARHEGLSRDSVRAYLPQESDANQADKESKTSNNQAKNEAYKNNENQACNSEFATKLTEVLENKLDTVTLDGYYLTNEHCKHIEETVIRPKCEEKIQEALHNNLCLGVAFAGMILMCIPCMQAPGAVVVAVASLLYFQKNGYRFASFLDGFFAKSDKANSAESKVSSSTSLSKSAK